VTLVVSKAARVALLLYIWYNTYMSNLFVLSDALDVTYGRGYVYSLLYHIVWCTKYRKPVFTEDMAGKAKEYLLTTAGSLDMDVITMELMPDHVHMLVSCKPQLRLSDAIKVLKGNTARWLFLQHPELKLQLRDGHLWNPSYFVSTVNGRSKEQVEHYLNTQK